MQQKTSNLIYDIGAHKGDDTSVYLANGFYVIAVEANPNLCDELIERFLSEINSGYLKVINCIISDNDDKLLSFFLNKDSSKSSIYSGGISKEEIEVRSKRLISLFNEYGVPHYCKIDIEGADILALKSLHSALLPEYLSVEICGKPVKELIKDNHSLYTTLNQLYQLGYRKFKLVDQEKLQVFTNHSLYRSSLKITNRISNKVKNVLGIDFRTIFLKRNKLSKNAEISGSFGEDLHGNWLSFEETKRLVDFHFNEYLSVTNSFENIFWVDVHVKK